MADTFYVTQCSSTVAQQNLLMISKYHINLSLIVCDFFIEIAPGFLRIFKYSYRQNLVSMVIFFYKTIFAHYRTEGYFLHHLILNYFNFVLNYQSGSISHKIANVAAFLALSHRGKIGSRPSRYLDY